MADSISKVVKPQLRGLLHSQIKVNVIVATGLCIAAALVQKFTLNDQRKAKYSEFYKTYDIEKEFNEIRNKGLFDSAQAD